MLRLNSQYAKSYLRENTAQTGYFKQPANATKERGVPLLEENYQRVNRDRENEFQRSSYGNRRDNFMHVKNKNMQEQEYNEGNEEDYGQSKYGRQQHTNPLSTYNKSPKLAREQGFDVRQNLRSHESRQTQPYSKQLKYSKYNKYQKQDKFQRYENNSNHNSNYLTANRTDFVAKHNRRNEEIKSRIGRDGPYNTRNFIDYNCRQPMRNTQFQLKFSNKRDLDSQPYLNRQVRNRKEQECYEQRPQKYARKLQFEEETNQESQVSKTKDDLPQFRQRYDCRVQDYENVHENKTDRFQGRSIELNQRKNKLYKQIQQTPSRNLSSSFQPGSAQKKRSLIEKSQMLQEKLKKLTSTPTQFHSKLQKTSQFKVQQSRSRPTFNDRAQKIDQSLIRASKYSNINLNQQIVKQTPRNNESQQPYQRHSDILRTPSPILQSRGSNNQGEAIERIMDLNSKINERIQSIISNYAKK